MRKSLYNKSIYYTIHFYENYILPRDMNKNRKSLTQLKQQEFIDRKRLLNPYQKELLI